MNLHQPQANLRIKCPQCEQKLDASGVEAFSTTACPVCDYEVMVPYRFGQYLLEKPLSETPVAGVYRSLDLKLQREVAVKVLDSFVAREAEKTDKFLRATRESARLNHANVLPIYSCGEQYEHPFVVMEYLNGGSLATNIENNAEGLGVVKALHAVIQATRGLHAASQSNVIHGHVTPGNILLAKEGDVKMSDFGVALALKSEQRPFEDVRYTSPELLKGDGWDCRSDIYSLGGVLCHALTGVAPFGNDYAARMKGLSRSVEQSMGELWLHIPGELRTFISKCMDPDPDKRPNAYYAVLRSLTHISGTLEQSTVKFSEDTPSTPPKKRLYRNHIPRTEKKSDHKTKKKRTYTGLILQSIMAAVLLVLLLLLIHGAYNQSRWYVEKVNPAVRWVAVHVGALDPEEYQSDK
ncbi:MAG: serine/threonine-protein kinase [Lentisphaeria bacterium]